MTSWRCITCLFLFVFLSMVDLSEEDCKDYFSLSNWGANLTDTVSLVITEDPKDIMECTVERECLERRNNCCYWLVHCLDREDAPKEKSAKCKGNSSDGQNVSFYHFMCMTAKAFTDKAPPEVDKACQYGTACQLYPEIPAYTETTTTTTTTTTTPPPTTTLPELTTTEATTTTSTTSTTVLPPTTTAKTQPTLPTTTQSAVSGSNDKHSEDEDKTHTFRLELILMVSVSFNVILLVAVLLFMHQCWKQRRTQWDINAIHVSNEHIPDNQLDEPLVSADKDKVESSLLTQPDQCHAVVTEDPKDPKRSCSADGEETLL